MPDNIKDGVRFSSPEMAMCMADSVIMKMFDKWNSSATVITGGVEKHQHPSKHVYGGGLDYRIWNLTIANRNGFTKELRTKLGDGFDVVLESDHIHVEYDPKD